MVSLRKRVSLVKSAETIAAGTERGNALRTARFVTWLVDNIGR